MSAKSFEIEGRLVGPSLPVYFIADIAANHDGDLEKAKDLIYLSAEAGADAAKFQHFQAETIVSNQGFLKLNSIKSHQSNWSKSVFETYKDASVNLDWTNTLKETCAKAGITFFTTPYSLELVDYIDSFVNAYKIGSGDITWIEMIEKVASKQKPYFMATGASNMDDVSRAVDAAIAINTKICLMQCNTNYTGSLENFKYINLHVLNSFKRAFPEILMGLSDHTPGHSTVLGAVALGARVIEKHFTNDTTQEGPDHKFAMDPSSWSEMVLRTKELLQALGDGEKTIEENEKNTVIVQRRSVCAKFDMKPNDKITEENVTYLRPAPNGSVAPYQATEIFGKRVLSDISAGEPILWTNVK